MYSIGMQILFTIFLPPTSIGHLKDWCQLIKFKMMISMHLRMQRSTEHVIYWIKVGWAVEIDQNSTFYIGTRVLVLALELN
jgi:hypothetical protein